MEEVLEFRHSQHLMGIGVLHAVHTARKWHVVNSAFGLAVPSDWIGEISYRRQRRVFQAGNVFCTEPGEVHHTSRVLRSGAFKVLLIDELPLRDYLQEIAPHLRSAHFRNIGGAMSPQLAKRLNMAFELIGRDAAPLHVQSCMIELMASVVDELVDDPKPRLVLPRPAPTLERARECLHDDKDGWTDLDTLAREAGLSRFHLLRSFKARYGLPPHAYQVGVRIAKAQRLLRRRVPLAQVAAECGFTDQSHFTRHFKQVLGVTPGLFARDFSGKRQ